MTGSARTEDLWIRSYHPAGPQAPTLVVLPHAGGSSTFYFPMSQALAPRIEVLTVQYPGRQDRHREPRLESIPEFAEELLPLLEERLDGPFALYGHSMGATLAFELARGLEKSGFTPHTLFVSARTAPSRHRLGERVHQGTDEEFLEQLRILGGADQQVFGNEELMQLALPACRSDYKAAETYHYEPGPPLSCPVHAMRGDSDPMADESEVRAWGEHTTGAFTLDTYRGGHFYLIEHQAAVRSSIARALLGSD